MSANRIFLAFELPADIKAHLAIAQAAIEPLAEGRRIPSESLHLTLKFLGDVDDELIARLIGVLGQVQWNSPRLRATDLICFPERGEPRIVAAQFEDEQARCAALAESIDKALEPLGFQRESRRFCPHATLLRLKRSPRDLRGHLREIAASIGPGPGFSPAGISLFSSQRFSGGAVYRRLAAISEAAPALTTFSPGSRPSSADRKDR